jgi:hypothetical protein
VHDQWYYIDRLERDRRVRRDDDEREEEEGEDVDGNKGVMGRGINGICVEFSTQAVTIADHSAIISI